MLDLRVTDPQKSPAKSVRPSEVQTEEQRLCNEALTSHQFDGITDEQWVAMCEQVAQDARHSGPAGLEGEPSEA
jgi:hypothetical protein